MEVKVEKLIPGGQALGVLPDGKKVLIWGALPGEIVEVEITKSKKSYAEGIAKKIIEKSPRRVEPKDDCYLSTSPWQIMDYDYELEQKKTLIIEAFYQAGVEKSSDVAFEAIWRLRPKFSDEPRHDGREESASEVMSGDFSVVTDNKEYNYRNKMEYSLWWSNGTNKISLAFHKRGTHQKIPIEGSSIERPEIFAEAMRIIDELNSKNEPARKYQSLMLRSNQNGEVSGGLFENGKPHPNFKPLTDTILGKKYTYSPNGFFQINIPVYELALQQIKHHIDLNLPIVDMYAGVGAIGLSVANTNQPLTLVETNKDAFRELKNNCLGVKAAKPILSSAENAKEYITSDINLIVDPPRAGLDDTLVDKILESTPKKVVYLSCNPITQARDIVKLLPKYSITEMTGFNFFPRTPHIENLAVLERTK